MRNGAAVMAMTESDGATASQKCDPYAVGFEDCESFLRGEETEHIHQHTKAISCVHGNSKHTPPMTVHYKSLRHI